MHKKFGKSIGAALAGLFLMLLIAACGDTVNPTSQAGAVSVAATSIAATTTSLVTTTDAPTTTNAPAPTATPEPTTENATTLAPTTAPTTTIALPTATNVPPPPSPTTIPDVGILPTQLRIPVIGVNAKVEHVGKTANGAMDVPKDVFNVAWFDLGVKPGNSGNAVIDGHLDGYNIPAAVFINLDRLQPGNKVYVRDDKGKELTFEVYGKQVYDYDKAPLDKIFGSAFESHLNLITCNGTFDNKNKNYSQRLVVFTKLVNS